MGLCVNFCTLSWFDIRFLFLISLIFGFAIICAALLYRYTIKWCSSPTCLVGKTAIVTGSNTGIGYQVALEFAKRGARVILACRNEKKAREAMEKIAKSTGNKNVVFKLVDMCSLSSVKNFAKITLETEERLDILVNNAGIGGTSRGAKTEDGFNVTTQVNHLSAFLLTNLLMPLLLKTPGSRIVNTSSIMGKFTTFQPDKITGYTGASDIYNKSKLYNILFTKELARRLKGKNVAVYSLNPGAVMTDIFSRLSGIQKLIFHTLAPLVFKSPLEGAQTSIYVSVEQGIEEHSGGHFQDCTLIGDYTSACYPNAPKILWDKTVEALDLNSEDIVI